MNRLIALCLVLLTIGAVSGDHHKLLKKFATKKVFESCFGEAQVKEWYHKIYKATKECKAEIYGVALPGGANAVRAKPSFDWDGFFDGSRGRNIASRRDNTPDYFYNRQKRSSHVPFHEERVRATKDKFLEHLKCGACVLKKCGVLDDQMQMNWAAISQLYSEVNVEPELKEDLMEILDQCKHFSQCYTAGKSTGGFPIGLKQAMVFMKCEKKKKALACVKKDLRKNPDLFELNGLDGILEGSEYDEQDEQALKFLMMHSKVGESEYAFFE